jgi:alkylation response protein AidB-like acyl-CoA dehydrogenase
LLLVWWLILIRKKSLLSIYEEKICCLYYESLSRTDWDITHNRRDLPPEVWEFIKQNKFCGIIIPKHYGGLEFGEYAHSQIVMKISSRSASAAVTVMVPKSLFWASQPKQAAKP